jgi:hypothetical protein
MWRKFKHWFRDALPFPILLRGYYLHLFTGYYLRYESTRRKAGLPLLDGLDLNALKSSDTLFVLGSGPSINKISPERWQAIARNDTVALNFWLYHPFVPKIYFFEGFSATREANVYNDICKKRAADYANTPKILMDLADESTRTVCNLPAEWKKNTYVAYTIPAVARTDEEFAYALRYLVAKGVFARASRTRALFKHCATLSTLVALGVKMGYRRIVLCGVDLTNNEYYYQSAEDFPDHKDLELIPRQRKHATLTRYAWGNTPIDVVLAEMKRQILEPAAIELYVEHKGSALWPMIPVAPESLFESDAPRESRASAVMGRSGD